MAASRHKRPIKNGRLGEIKDQDVLCSYGLGLAIERLGGRDGGGTVTPTPVGKDRPRPWNKGLLVGQKKPLEPKHVWSIRARLEIARSRRDLAIFNLRYRSDPDGVSNHVD